jgi:hypothetical protein
MTGARPSSTVNVQQRTVNLLRVGGVTLIPINQE